MNAIEEHSRNIRKQKTDYERIFGLLCEERAGLIINSLSSIKNKIKDLDNTIENIVDGAPEGEFFDQPEQQFEINRNLPATEIA